MSSDLEKFLDHVDEWKFKLHEKLKGMTPAQRKEFWKQIHEEARARGLNVVEPEEPAEAGKNVEAANQTSSTNGLGL
jgi:hypothetical protein